MLTTCQRHLKQVNGKDGIPPPGRYVPQCTEAGEYETIQCYGSTGYCWCVNENGEEVEGSRRGPGKGSPNCHGKFKSIIRVNYGAALYLPNFIELLKIQKVAKHIKMMLMRLG